MSEDITYEKMMEIYDTMRSKSYRDKAMAYDAHVDLLLAQYDRLRLEVQHLERIALSAGNASERLSKLEHALFAAGYSRGPIG